MKTEDRGYRVSAAPSQRGTPVTDSFVLRQSAIECAQRLDSIGWVAISVKHVTAEVFDDCEFEEAAVVEWRAAA